MSKSPTTAFFGTPHLAVWVLEELEYAGILPDLVVTTPDKPVGRKLTLTPPPTKVWADEHDIPTLQVDSLKDKAAVPELANTDWDLCIVAAYNTILPSWVLELPRHGVLNVHPSLLPKMRGPSPIRSAILTDAKDAVGASVMQLDEEVDHGPVLAQASVELDEWPVRGSILDEMLFREGGKLLADVLEPWCEGALTAVPQEHDKATFSKKFKKADGEIRLADDGYHNYLKYCAFDGWPGVYFFDKQGVRVKVVEAALEDGVFVPKTVIPEGKNKMTYQAYVHMVME